MDNSDQSRRLLMSFYSIHQDKLNNNIVQVGFIFLMLSLAWNYAFRILNVSLSRADVGALLLCTGVCLVTYVLIKFSKLPVVVLKHITLWFVCFVVVSLYFGSGYREAWSFFLLIPIVSALYGDIISLTVYSILGLISMVALDYYFPLVPRSTFDIIDLSNRVLLYIILATFSHILYKKLLGLYVNLVSIVTKSADESLEQVVKTFIVSVEAKDTYTFGHSERVSEYAVELARKLPEYQNNPKKLHTLKMMGLLHDIGKINIPESILTKPSRLTDMEYEIIKTHTVVGAKMVEKISLLGRLKDGVLYHHERWDGLGYPSGMKGEEIPLEARILAIADAFDAMTSNRAYRDAMAPSQAFRRLLEGRGTCYDPRLIDILTPHQFSWISICKQSNSEVSEFETLMTLQ
ncbi:HD-GYP domain-containing protein [Paenibacillus hexagrammi]|uniref:HD-GYP domain-containing protein n=1 Tax=Paenibacillus hexagrammi TaxID=2908839 RepID=A0ABY3SLN1_9BACL|nr:HD-GYP domain-containing protein [Paenibacillus sp. YPD9-1]UJF34624.1 HD-GYP domain-containing protein [Paenibacillus sp. YPD9-1]